VSLATFTTVALEKVRVQQKGQAGATAVHAPAWP